MEKRILDGYNSPEGSAKYTKKFEKHWTERINNEREQRLVRGLLSKVPEADLTGFALDMPCGYGRLYPLLGAVTARVVEGDWSFYLLQAARQHTSRYKRIGPPHGFVRGTALALPFSDNAFDLVLSVRLCHHISSRHERHQYVRELLRVSRKWVVFTFFDTYSLKNRLRNLRRRFVDKKPKWTMSEAEVATLANESGFETVRSVPLSRFFSGHRYVMLRHSPHIGRSR